MNDNNNLRSTKHHRTVLCRAGFGLSMLAIGLLGIGTSGGCVEVDERLGDESVRQDGDQTCELVLRGNTTNDLFAGPPGSPATWGLGWTLPQEPNRQMHLALELQGNCKSKVRNIRVRGGLRNAGENQDPMYHDLDVTIESSCTDVANCEISTEDGDPTIDITVNEDYRDNFNYMLEIVTTSEILPEQSGGTGDSSDDILICTEATAPTFRTDHVDAGMGMSNWRERVGAWVDIALATELENGTLERAAAIDMFCTNNHPYPILESEHHSSDLQSSISSWQGEWSRFHGIVKDGTETVGVIVDGTAIKSNSINYKRIGHLISECLANHENRNPPTCVTLPGDVTGCSGDVRTRCIYDEEVNMSTFDANCSKRIYQLEDIQRWGLAEHASGFLWEGGDIRVFSDNTCNGS